MSKEYEGKDPIALAQQAERDLNSYQAKSGTHGKFDYNTSDSTLESGINTAAADKFPGGEVKVGSSASGAGDNREIPVEEGGDLISKPGENSGVGHPTKARDFEGPGGPETKQALYEDANPGNDDVNLRNTYSASTRELLRGMSKNHIEAQGLLQPESFDIDDLESAEPQTRAHTNGHVRSPGEEWPRGRKTWTSALPWLRRRWVIVGLATVAALLVVGIALNKGTGIKRPMFRRPRPGSKPANGGSPIIQWEKPREFKIIGLIFFGRPPVVEILDCYLKRNLVSNGGWLDEVHFAVNTKNEDDIKYLDRLVTTSDRYKKITIPSVGYNEVWGHAVEREHLYIKIDDDIVYFNDEAIPDIVYTKIHHPNSLNVVANLINSPETGWLHYRFGAIHSYLPELNPPTNPSTDSKGPTAWRASALPEWTGKDMSFPVAGANGAKPDDGGVLDPSTPGAPPFKGHRWLPLPDDEANLWRTPMAESMYDPDGPDWGSWSLGAQAHYSFLQNLESGNLSFYHYGHGIDEEREGLWNMAYQRMNINFMAIWGKDVLDNLPFETTDDELELSVTVNKKLRRPLLVNTHAIAAHFSFRSQHEMYDTDLLDRYRAYANEFICRKDNQIPTG